MVAWLKMSMDSNTTKVLSYIFTFEGQSVGEFSIQMWGFGDYNPSTRARLASLLDITQPDVAEDEETFHGALPMELGKHAVWKEVQEIGCLNYREQQ